MIPQQQAYEYCANSRSGEFDLLLVDKKSKLRTGKPLLKDKERFFLLETDKVTKIIREEIKMTNELLKAVELLKGKEWVDLTHTFGPASPHFAAFPDAEFETLFDHDDGFFAQSFKFAGQYGTHIDAPIHFVRDTRFLDELGLKELVLPLVVLDYSKEAAENHDFTLSVENILQFEEKHGQIEAGSFVALRTDWSKRWPDREAFNNKDDAGNNRIPG